jgi:hypothetical protein
VENNEMWKKTAVYPDGLTEEQKDTLMSLDAEAQANGDIVRPRAHETIGEWNEPNFTYINYFSTKEQLDFATNITNETVLGINRITTWEEIPD